MANARCATAQTREVRPALKRHRPHSPDYTSEQFWRGDDGAVVSFSPTPEYDRTNRDLSECEWPTLERTPTSTRRYKSLLARHTRFDILLTSCNICILGNSLCSEQYRKFVIMLSNHSIHQCHSCLSAANCFSSSSDTFLSAFSFVAFKKILGTID
jgi:hypothetical protein